jgi:hypothetical protein
MPILASTNFVNGYGKASVVTAGVGALPLESFSEGQDTFVVKYNTSGKAQWSARIGSSGTGADTGFGITTDSSGNVYVTGQGGSGGVVTAFNSDGTAFGTIANSGNTDAFIVKYDTNGTVQWVARIASLGAEIGYAIATDSSGNVYVTGQGGGAVGTAFSSNGVAFGTAIENSGGGDAFIVKYNTNGIVQWVARVGSANADIGYGIATDSSGNVYVTGQGGSGIVVTAFSSNGAGFGTTLPSSGGTDAFIVKYNTSGFVQWVARVASTAVDIGYGIASDSSGNVYVTGQGGSGAVVTAFDSNGTAFGTTLANSGNTDAFIVKYNTSGFVQWVARVASTAADIGYSIATDSSGNVYVTGQGGSGAVVTAFNSNGTAFGTTLANSGNTDVFIVKYDTNGTVQWVARVSSTAADIGYGIATDSSGNVYVIGQGGSGVVVTAFNSNGTAFGTTISNSGNTDAFIVKYDTNGTVQWLTRVASPGVDIARAIAIDSGGNVYLTGQYTASPFSIYGSALSLFSTIPNAGGNDTFVVKYGASGDPQWVARVASTDADIGYSIATDSSGNVYVTGQCGSGVVVTAFSSNGVAFGTTLPSSGNTDAFIVKYNTSGIVQWVARVASTAADIGYGIASDSSGNVYVTGQGGSGAVVTAFNSNGTAFGTTLANSGNTDAFIVKYNTSGFVQWVARVASTAADIGYSIATDSSGNVYVAGQGGAIATAFSSNGVAFGTTIANSGGNDAFIVKYNTNGIVQWVARIGSGNADIGYGIATDSSGNVYVTGQGGSGIVVTAFSSNGAGFGTTLPSSGGTDAFIVKYNTSGFVQWVARVASTAVDIGYGIASDSSGNVYVIGQGGSGAIVTAFNSNGNAFGTTLINAGGTDAFIVKYNTNGFVQWIARVASTAADIGYGIATDSSGNVYVTCQTSIFGEITIFNSDTNTFAVTKATTGIIKYNTNGFAQWFQSISGTSSATLNIGIAVDTNNNAYITGASASGQATQIHGGGNSGLFRVLSSAGAVEAFVMKQTSNGNVQWLAQINGAGNDTGFAIAADSSGNVYVTGRGAESGTILVTAFNSDGTAFGTTIANTGSDDAFIVKYNTNGFVQWVARIASVQSDVGYGITTDSSGNVYITGQGAQSATIVVTAFNSDGTAFATTFANSGSVDAFIAKYDTNGFVQWLTRVASPNYDIGYAISTDSSGNVYVSGVSDTGTTTAYNANGTAFATTLSSADRDAFIVKYNTSGTVQWLTRIASASTDIGYGIATDSGGNVYVTGQGAFTSHSVVVFNANGTTFTTLANAGQNIVFIVKYNTAGAVQWATRIDGTSTDIGYAIATDSSGNVYVTGNSSSSTITAYNSDGTAFGTTLTLSDDAFIVKYNTSGFVQWIAGVGGNGSEQGYGIRTDSAGDVYICGISAVGTGILNAFNADGTTFGTAITKSSVSAPLFIVKYSSSGVVQWISRTAGQGIETARGIAIDGSSNIYTTGSFNGGYLVAYNA